MNILLVDDHALFREGMRHVLKQFEASVVVLEAADVGAALEILRQRDDLDIVLLDLALPDAKKFDALSECRRLQPQVPVVVLSSSEDRFEIERAMSLGAQAYVFKSSSSQTMLAALRRVMKGEIVVPDLGDTELAIGIKGDGRSGELTARQTDVLRMLSRGLSNKEIADTLGLTENTVKVHLANIYRALGVTNRTAALLKAIETGLIDGP